MANNRMYLVCRGCGKGLLIGKNLNDGYYAFYDDMTTKLNEFYNEHNYCGEVHPENQFQIEYEFALDEDTKEYKF